MELNFDIAGEVVERQELLNGTQTVTLEGATEDALWRLSAVVSWNIGLESNTGEGDITLARRDGAELYGTLARGDVAEAPDAADASHTLSLEYEIDGGSGEFASASGRIIAEGSLSEAIFELTLHIAP